jgi:hypothetical protein
MSANELIAEIKALPESERDRVYRLLMADLEFRRALQSSVPTASQPTGSTRPLAKLAGAVASFPSDPQMPTDAAAQHDHYLYGTPKTS